MILACTTSVAITTELIKDIFFSHSILLELQGQMEGRASRSQTSAAEREAKETKALSAVSTRSEKKDADVTKEKVEIPVRIRRRVEQEYVKIRNAHKEKRTRQIIVSDSLINPLLMHLLIFF